MRTDRQVCPKIPERFRTPEVLRTVDGRTEFE